jgi:CRISPR-associated protein Cas5d
VSLELKVWGDFALFTRPETKSEPQSYPAIIPSAARGILEAIFWKPEFRYKLHSAKVLNPIKFLNLKINNLDTRVNPKDVLKWSIDKKGGFAAAQNRTQRNYVLLKDVAYVIKFDLILEQYTEHPLSKYIGQFSKRVDKGSCFSRPFFGCKEFVAYFDWATGQETVAKELEYLTIDMGTVCHALDFVPSQAKKLFYNKAFDSTTGERGFKPGYMQSHYKDLKIENGIIIF